MSSLADCYNLMRLKVIWMIILQRVWPQSQTVCSGLCSGDAFSVDETSLRTTNDCDLDFLKICSFVGAKCPRSKMAAKIKRANSIFGATLKTRNLGFVQLHSLLLYFLNRVVITFSICQSGRTGAVMSQPPE
jgi:hypothetical protein